MTTVRRAADAPRLVTGTDLPPAGHFIDGAFAEASTERVIDVVDPCRENVIARIPEGTSQDVDRAVAAAVRARARWARLVPKERSELLHAVADRLAEHTEPLSRLESANTGKPLAVSRDDVAMTVDLRCARPPPWPPVTTPRTTCRSSCGNRSV
ncbi:aldehyde dehydrogenase family protein [Streptomyces sp. IMTB 2501]|uniref:aldehyde dehydrogenase family protein n=1 Tax=Streptomyces sp. IMTB 2501 TaxID=1776340 RepID=UPI001C4B9551|nr:aldehyde dehydrogenase family protein [Streptomyces sp. IMTB 2501]